MFSAMCSSRYLPAAAWSGNGSMRSQSSRTRSMSAQPGCCGQRERRHRRQRLAPAASYNTNPQNVEQCQVKGRAKLSCPAALASASQHSGAAFHRHAPATASLPTLQTPPSPEYTAEQAVAIQLTALQRNNEPWGNHGVQVSAPLEPQHAACIERWGIGATMQAPLESVLLSEPPRPLPLRLARRPSCLPRHPCSLTMQMRVLCPRRPSHGWASPACRRRTSGPWTWAGWSPRCSLVSAKTCTTLTISWGEQAHGCRALVAGGCPSASLLPFAPRPPCNCPRSWAGSSRYHCNDADRALRLFCLPAPQHVCQPAGAAHKL